MKNIADVKLVKLADKTIEEIGKQLCRIFDKVSYETIDENKINARVLYCVHHKEKKYITEAALYMIYDFTQSDSRESLIYEYCKTVSLSIIVNILKDKK